MLTSRSSRLVVVLVLLLVGSLLTAMSATSATAADPPPSVTGIASRSGPLGGGQLVTVRGFNLGGTTSVLFGSVRTTDVQVVSPTQLTVRTPAHGEGRVYVRTARPGAVSRQASVATYFFLPRPRALTLGRATAHTDLDFVDVSCASATFCGAGGEHFIDSAGHFAGAVWNGTRWGAQRQLEEDGFAVDAVSVSCVASPAKLCMFGTTFGHVWRTNGTTWSVTDLTFPAGVRDGEQLPRISCVTSNFCKAVAGDHVWTWNGSTWGVPEKVLGANGRAPGAFIDISCPTTVFCYGVLRGSPATAIRWQRGTWEPSRTILPTGTFYAITCSSAAYCLASGDFGSGLTFLAYTGLAWSPPQPGTLTFSGSRQLLECTSPTACMRGGSRYETYNGSARQLVDPRPQDGVSCWTAYRCLVFRSRQSFTTVAGSR